MGNEPGGNLKTSRAGWPTAMPLFLLPLLVATSVGCSDDPEEVPECTVTPAEVTAEAMSTVVFTLNCPQPSLNGSWIPEDLWNDGNPGTNEREVVMPALPGEYEVVATAWGYDNLEGRAKVTVTPNTYTLDDRVRFRTGFKWFNAGLRTWRGRDQVLVYGYDNTIRTLRTDTWDPGKGIGGMQFSLPEFNADGQYALVTSDLGNVPFETRWPSTTIWDVEAGTLNRMFQTHPGVPASFDMNRWHPDGHQIAGGNLMVNDLDQELPHLTAGEATDENGNTVWQATSRRGGDLSAFTLGLDNPTDKLYSSDGSYLITLGSAALHVWDPDAGALIANYYLEYHRAGTPDLQRDAFPGVAMLLSPEGTLVVISAFGLGEFDLLTGEELSLDQTVYGPDSPILLQGRDRPVDMVWSHDRSTIYITAYGPLPTPEVPPGVTVSMVAYDWATRTTKWVVLGDPQTNRTLMTLLDDGRILLDRMKGDKSDLYIVQPADGAITRLDVPRDGFEAVRYNAAGDRLLAMSSADGVRLYNATTGAQLWHRADVVWGGWDGDVAVVAPNNDNFTPMRLEWVDAAGTATSTLDLADDGSASYFSFNPSGTELTVGGFGTIKRYDTTTGVRLPAWGPCPVHWPHEYLRDDVLAGDGAVCNSTTGAIILQRSPGQTAISGDGTWVAHHDGSQVTVHDVFSGASHVVSFERDVDCLALNEDGTSLLAKVARTGLETPVWHVVDVQTGVTDHTFQAPFAVVECQHAEWNPARDEVVFGTNNELVVFDVSPSAK